MKNKKITKIFNVISLSFVCAMIVCIELFLLIDGASPYFFNGNSGNEFFMNFIIALTAINIVKFIIEGIKTFDDNSLLTGGNKVQKITLAVIDVLFVLAMVLVVVRPAQLSKTSVYSNAIKSVYVLVPFAIFNTIRFFIYKDNAVFAQGYKKPFKMAFIAGNILLILAMAVHAIIAKITNETLRSPAFEPIVFYTFILAIFNGIKFFIDDIKAARKSEFVLPLFWKSMPKRIMAIISAIILFGIAAFASGFWYTHSTHYLYDDTYVIGKTAEQIAQRYGKYDKEFGASEKGYCVDKGNTSRELPIWPKYYMISFDKSGIAYKVEIVEGGWGG